MHCDEVSFNVEPLEGILQRKCGAGAGVSHWVRVRVCQYVPHADWIHDSSLLLLSAHVRARHRGLPAHLVRRHGLHDIRARLPRPSGSWVVSWPGLIPPVAYLDSASRVGSRTGW